MEFSSDVLTLEVAEHVATLWLDRPEARNAMGRALWRDLPLAAEAIASDPTVRVVVVAARGPAFSVGLDLKDMGAGLLDGAGPGASDAARTQSTYETIRTMQASITAIADLEVGTGTEAVLARHGSSPFAGPGHGRCTLKLS